ncbi:MAG: 30S ribosomal protein S7, partial [archaeon]|nr:30S ribosomal protein S7 [archaeon]
MATEKLFLFRKWNMSEVKVKDKGLEQVISLKPIITPVSMGRH